MAQTGAAGMAALPPERLRGQNQERMIDLSSQGVSAVAQPQDGVSNDCHRRDNHDYPGQQNRELPYFVPIRAKGLNPQPIAYGDKPKCCKKQDSVTLQRTSHGQIIPLEKAALPPV